VQVAFQHDGTRDGDRCSHAATHNEGQNARLCVDRVRSMWETTRDWAPIAISLISVGIASFALYRNIRYGSVEPHWRIEVMGRGSTTDDGRYIKLRAVNIGDGDGFEVRIGELTNCNVNEKGVRAFATDRVNSGDHTGVVHLFRPDDDWSTVTVEVEWTRRPTHLRRTGRLTLGVLEAIERFDDKPKLRIITGD
jgi:hypothetical protein